MYTYTHTLSRYELMRNCWEQQPELRPTFATISRKLTTTITPGLTPDDGDMIYDTVASDTTWDEDAISNTGDWSIDGDSLLSSIIELLPNAYPCQHSVKVKVHSNAAVTTTPPEDSDHYIHMNRLMKKSVSAGNVRAIQRDNAYYPKATVGVARNISNVSDYFLMFPAEPAKPKDR